MKLYCYCYEIPTKFDSISYRKKVENSPSTKPFESPNIDLIIFAPTIHNKILANRSYYTHKPLYSKISNSRSSLRHKKKKKKKDIAFYHRAKSNQFISEHSRIESKDPIESNRQILGEETWFSPRGFSIIRKCCSPSSNGRIIRRWERNFNLQGREGEGSKFRRPRSKT